MTNEGGFSHRKGEMNLGLPSLLRQITVGNTYLGFDFHELLPFDFRM